MPSPPSKTGGFLAVALLALGTATACGSGLTEGPNCGDSSSAISLKGSEPKTGKSVTTKEFLSPIDGVSFEMAWSPLITTATVTSKPGAPRADCVAFAVDGKPYDRLESATFEGSDETGWTVSRGESCAGSRSRANVTFYAKVKDELYSGSANVSRAACADQQKSKTHALAAPELG